MYHHSDGKECNDKSCVESAPEAGNPWRDTEARTLRRMSIYWGVRPLKTIQYNTTDDMCNGAIELQR